MTGYDTCPPTYPARKKGRSIQERVLDRVTPGWGGCWIWTSSTNTANYAKFSVAANQCLLVHRLSYELFVAPIPEGMVLDHLCHTRDASCPGGLACLHRRCVNPAHLELVTPQQNILRSQTAPGGQYGRRTHCEKGHEFTPENTRWRKRPDNPEKTYRVCRECMRIWKATHKARKAATS